MHDLRTQKREVASHVRVAAREAMSLALNKMNSHKDKKTASYNAVPRRLALACTHGLLGKRSPVLSVHAPYVGVRSGPIGLSAGTRSRKSGPSRAGGRGSFT